MKHTLALSSLLVGSLWLLSQNSFAYETEEPEEVCKIPKVVEFNLPLYVVPEKHEVAPEADFSFKVSGRGADPKKIRVNVHNNPLKLDITQNSSFINVKGKLPAELTGQFVRLDVQAGTDLGCRAKHGWLIKIAGAAPAQPAAAEAAPAAQPTPVPSTPAVTAPAPAAQ